MAKQFNLTRSALTLGSLLFLASSCADEPLLEAKTVGAVNTHSSMSDQPTVLDQNLEVRTVVTGLVTPTTCAFLGPDDLLVLEKNTGRVKRVAEGTIRGTVLDLAVNFASERGLLGITLHPNFPTNPSVYLFWTKSTSGTDSNVRSQTSLLGNRVDRFIWNESSSSLSFDRNLILLRALQADAGEPERGNHNGGVLRFGPDGKLYIFVGDVNRQGQLQNLPCGPTADCPGRIVADDQFGGPEPDDAHLTGVILRLNDDGSTPADNPFFGAGAAKGGEVGANIQKIFSYGHRNSFGMAFNPLSGNLWLQENGDDAFSEVNRVLPGMNGGWIQFMGPVSRQFTGRDSIGRIVSNSARQFTGRDSIGIAFNTARQFTGRDSIGRIISNTAQQLTRRLPISIANLKEEVRRNLYMLPGAHYADPEFSWQYEVAPAGIGFITGQGLGSQFNGNLILGAARDFPQGGHLFRLRPPVNQRMLAMDGSRQANGFADYFDKGDITEGENILFGKNFGVGTDVQTGPNGNLFVVSLSRGAIYEIFHRRDLPSAVSRR